MEVSPRLATPTAIGHLIDVPDFGKYATLAGKVAGPGWSQLLEAQLEKALNVKEGTECLGTFRLQ